MSDRLRLLTDEAAKHASSLWVVLLYEEVEQPDGNGVSSANERRGRSIIAAAAWVFPIKLLTKFKRFN